MRAEEGNSRREKSNIQFAKDELNKILARRVKFRVFPYQIG